MATETLPVNDWAPPAPSPAPPPAPGVGRFGEPWGISSKPGNVTMADGAASLLELPEEERAAVIHARVRRSVVCVNAMNGIAFPAGLMRDVRELVPYLARVTVPEDVRPAAERIVAALKLAGAK